METPSEKTQEQARREAWLQERRNGVGGSDVAAILGLSTYRTAFDVWAEKVGKVPIEGGPDPERFWWGHALEGIIARRYAERTGARVVYDPDRIMRHPQHPELIATPDRLIHGANKGLEIKTADRDVIVTRTGTEAFGPDGSTTIPSYYLCQVMHYMMVTNLDSWDVAALIRGSDLRIYTLYRNKDAERDVRDFILEWWDRHVVKLVPPPITGGRSVGDTLARMFPSHDVDLLEGTEEDEALIRRFLDEAAAAAQKQKDVEELKNMLKARIGDSAGVRANAYKATWKKSRDVRRMDWEGYAKALIETLRGLGVSDEIERLRAEHEAVVPGSRRFYCMPPLLSEGE